jgi:beta-aspartyl-peptidase (threonine type)
MTGKSAGGRFGTRGTLRRFLFLALTLAVVPGCAPPPDAPRASATPHLAWAIAIQAGAGVMSRSVDEANRQEHLDSLGKALAIGQRILQDGGTSLDAVEQVLIYIEDDPRFNAGRGAVYNHDGGHELDASIMDGSDHACGAVAGVTTVKNPIALARDVMERSPHVLLAGAGAERFADEMEVERVTQEYFHTEHRLRQWQELLRREADPDAPGTAGAVALDRHGNLAAGTSTGGLTDKRFGRIGDSPIIGAGTYADNATCAVSGTGQGEEYIRFAVGHRISALMAYGGRSLQDAAEEVILRTLQDGDGGLVAVDRDGNIAMVFNTEGMFRGAADSSGRFEVAIWK